MAPKSKTKTQKRNQQKRANAKKNGTPEKAEHSNRQQKEMSKMAEDLRETQKQLMGLQNLKTLWTAGKLPPPPSAGVDSKTLDEKYIKVPDPVEVAVTQAKQCLEAFANPNKSKMDSAMHDTKRIETVMSSLNVINEAVQKAKNKPKDHIKASHKIMSAIGLHGVKPLLDSEAGLGFTRSVLRAGLGDRPIKIKAVSLFVITTTVTTGVTNTVDFNSTGLGRLSPVDVGEWSSLSALFDEVKCTGGELVFDYNNPPNETISKNINMIPIIGYEPDDPTLATVTLATAALAQHKLLKIPVIAFGSESDPPANCTRQIFDWHVPRGTAFGDPTTPFNSPTTEWMTVENVASNQTNVGYIKFYHIGTVVTAINTGVGLSYMHLEFRCRS